MKIETKRFSGYIAINSENELVNAIRTYSQRGSGLAEKKIVQEIRGTMKNSLAEPLMVLCSVMKNNDVFVEEVIYEIKTRLSRSDYFVLDYEYDGYGTNFFKTTINGYRYKDDMYFLRIFSLDDQPIRDLARTLNKELLLVNIEHRISFQSAGRIKIGMIDFLKKLGIAEDRAEMGMKHIANDSSRYAEFEYHFSGCKFPLGIMVHCLKDIKYEDGFLSGIRVWNDTDPMIDVRIYSSTEKIHSLVIPAYTREQRLNLENASNHIYDAILRDLVISGHI